MVIALLSAIISAGAVIGLAIVLRNKLLSASGSETTSLQTELDTISANIDTAMAGMGDLVSKKQLDSIEGLIASEGGLLEKEKLRLQEVETKLETAQKQVEEKEGTQQDAKTVKDEDENKLKELLAAYENLSNESIDLERKLAASLKSMETIVSDDKYTDEQKAFLNNLISALTEGGGRLRELITEYQAINDRVSGLESQHHELEEEYTKLVEQQLGE